MSRKKPEAPGRLDVIREFVNTVDYDYHIERLDSPDNLKRWLREHDLLERGASVGEGDLRNVTAVREALRERLKANNGMEADAAALPTLRKAAERAGVALRFDPSGTTRLEPSAAGVDGAIGRLLTIVHEAEHDGTWERMKACPWHTCHWAFYDNTKNAGSVWCSMQPCGNRAKAKAYRERHAHSAG